MNHIYQIIIEWHDNYCLLNEESDFFTELKKLFPMKNKSQNEVENMVFKAIDNLPYNHYGIFTERTKIEHKIIY